MRRELQGLANGVQDPTEDDLPHSPAAVTLEEFLEGHRFVALLGGDARHRENLIDGVEQVIQKGVEPLGTALSDLDEVVYEHVGATQGALVHAIGRGSDAFRLGFEGRDSRHR